MGTTKAQIELEYIVNENLLKDIKRKRKFEGMTMTKERALGLMVEDHVKLQKALDKNKMTFDELLTSLKK